jgi:hypothetical protein
MLLAFQPAPTFRADSTLVLIHFHVLKVALYATDVKAEDLILLEDGIPRTFTRLRAPRSRRRSRST